MLIFIRKCDYFLPIVARIKTQSKHCWYTWLGWNELHCFHYLWIDKIIRDKNYRWFCVEIRQDFDYKIEGRDFLMNGMGQLTFESVAFESRARILWERCGDIWYARDNSNANDRQINKHNTLEKQHNQSKRGGL